jgi:dTDP-glucose pyrophosphorylase
MAKNLSNYIVQENVTVFDAAAAIDANGRQIVFICDGARLLASFSDGDFRRFIIKSGDVTTPIRNAANYNPIFLSANESAKAQYLIEKNPYIRGIPIVDENGSIVSVAFTNNTSARKQTKLDTPVVIMAGGKGTRLLPFTNVIPKPLIPVGEITITEHIIERFLQFGCDDFTMIVNHKKELIKAYISESLKNVNMRFVEEEFFQGTGGGLKLLDGKYNSAFFLTNCDILVEADYEDILKYHKKNSTHITMVCAKKRVSVPYGTVDLNEKGTANRLTEKPEFQLLTNTGLYVIEPSFLEIIPSGVSIHITDLIQKLIDDGQTVGVYIVSEESWLDMGQLSELLRMEKALGARELSLKSLDFKGRQDE